jgi:hypothetical protein
MRLWLLVLWVVVLLGAAAALNGCIALGGIGVVGSLVAGAAAGATTVAQGPTVAHVVHNLVIHKDGCRLVALWKCPHPNSPDF